ncbi:MAG: hypothetical protein CTY19_12495 [Methylomonas sp.]|nr:MAG: hypothetical protein CTY19_12495 [Methylomonas sp.]
MAIKWSDYWNSGDNNDVNSSFGKDSIISIITSISPSILRVQPAAVREAVNLAINDSSDVMIIKGLHHVGSEKIDIKKVGGMAGPTIHLYCMNYTLVDSGLRRPYDDVTRLGTGWRITGSSVYRGDGDESNQGMDKENEIAKSGGSKAVAQAMFKLKHYG